MNTFRRITFTLAALLVTTSAANADVVKLNRTNAINILPLYVEPGQPKEICWVGNTGFKAAKVTYLVADTDGEDFTAGSRLYKVVMVDANDEHSGEVRVYPVKYMSSGQGNMILSLPDTELAKIMEDMGFEDGQPIEIEEFIGKTTVNVSRAGCIEFAAPPAVDNASATPKGANFNKFRPTPVMPTGPTADEPQTGDKKK